METKKEQISVSTYYYRDNSEEKKIVFDYEEMVREFEERLQELENTYGDGDKIRLTIEWNR